MILKRVRLQVFLGAMLFSAASLAQDFPSGPIRMIVPWPAGGLVDIVGRSVGEQVSTELGRPVVVENKTGAGGMIGANAVLQAQSGQPAGSTAVVISADRNVKYESVVKVMDALQRAGVQRVGLSVQLAQ